MLRVDVPYQMATLLTQVYPFVPDGKIAVVARRCEEKAISELAKRELVDLSRLALIGLACSKEQVEACRCSDPCPSEVHIGECSPAMGGDARVDEIEDMSLDDRFDFWVDQFKKCNKCFGCTLNCPVCFCDDCVLEERTFVPEKGIPPGLAFHLIRSVHLADKCIECGECERSCPVDIPLLSLRKMINKDMREMFDYAAGDPERVSPLLTTLEGEPMEDDRDAC